ncbi:hypothetical protein PVL29_014501 [Vitis rotundifolia]|uniref:DUF4283 domain-containing protein n=1 Tax=Vitis rotundifolia TaxID=103349 RepID=A0AA39DM24_VITRO|nr:hypothetical protein PVL29_014501 [Vitis rotundifolia]
MRRWLLKENSKIEGKFGGGWIELQGLPFHLWFEVHSKKIVEYKARVRIAMKDRSVLPALIEVTDGDWVFTIAVVVVGEEDDRRGSVKGELTWEAFASNTGTGGGRQVERIRSTVGGRCRVGEDYRTRKGGERGMVVFHAGGTLGKGEQVHSLPSLNSNKTDDGPVEKEEAGGIRAGGDDASAVDGCRAYERKAQPLSKIGPTFEKVGCKSKGPSGMRLSPGGKDSVETEVSSGMGNDPSAAGKGKTTSAFCLEAQTSSLAKKKVTFSSKKLWSILLPPSSEPRQGLRCRSEPLLSGKDQTTMRTQRKRL